MIVGELVVSMGVSSMRNDGTVVYAENPRHSARPLSRFRRHR
jgi:hypothetical protein